MAIRPMVVEESECGMIILTVSKFIKIQHILMKTIIYFTSFPFSCIVLGYTTLGSIVILSLSLFDFLCQLDALFSFQQSH